MSETTPTPPPKPPRKPPKPGSDLTPQVSSHPPSLTAVVSDSSPQKGVDRPCSDSSPPVSASSLGSPSVSQNRLQSLTSALLKPFEGLTTVSRTESTAMTTTTNIAADLVAVATTTTTNNSTSVTAAELIAADADEAMGPVVRQGPLSKMNREGKFEPNIFTLTATYLFYHKEGANNAQEQVSTVNPKENGTGTSEASGHGSAASALPSTARERDQRCFPLAFVWVLLLEDGEFPGPKRERVFKVMTPKRSFFARAKTPELKQAWFTDIAKYTKLALGNGRPLTRMDVSPIWSALDVTKCQLCNKHFSFLSRKHHCRNCGKCVCEPCSADKVRILRLDSKNLLKVCTECSRDIKANRQYGATAADDAPAPTPSVHIEHPTDTNIGPQEAGH